MYKDSESMKYLCYSQKNIYHKLKELYFYKCKDFYYLMDLLKIEYNSDDDDLEKSLTDYESDVSMESLDIPYCESD